MTALGQRQRPAGLDPRQREAGDLRGGDGQVLGGEGQVFLLLAVEGVAGARVEGRQPAAREVVVHLGLDRLDGRRGGRRGIAQRQDGLVRLGLLPPIGVGLGVGEELVHLGLADAGLAAAVGLRAQAGDDVLDDLLGGVVLGRFRDDDAVAVEDRLRELLGVLAVSSTVMAVASAFFKVARICLAEASNCLPSGVASLMALSGSAGEALSRSSGFFRQPPAHLTAAISSGARMRPSLSVSIRARVALSNSSPVVGQARATHSFWSS